MISVIIPTYNEEKTIRECLESLLGQKKVDFEIIVVDDGSTDQTISEINKKQIINNKIKLLKQNHQGPGLARNLGAKHARGEILVFVDADMTFEEDFLYDLTQPIKEGLTRGTFSKNEFVANWDNVWARCWNYNQGIRENLRIPKSYPKYAPVFRAILKEKFEKVKGFEATGYTDDWSLSRKLGFMATKAPGAKCYHKNPETLEEVYQQANWIGKNEFITKGFKKIINLIRYSIPISLTISLVKSILYQEPKFLVFKAVYDWGVFKSIIGSFYKDDRYK